MLDKKHPKKTFKRKVRRSWLKAQIFVKILTHTFLHLLTFNLPICTLSRFPRKWLFWGNQKLSPCKKKSKIKDQRQWRKPIDLLSKNKESLFSRFVLLNKKSVPYIRAEICHIISVRSWVRILSFIKHFWTSFCCNHLICCMNNWMSQVWVNEPETNLLLLVL